MCVQLLHFAQLHALPSIWLMDLNYHVQYVMLLRCPNFYAIKERDLNVFISHIIFMTSMVNLHGKQIQVNFVEWIPVVFHPYYQK